jgi:hypothetical protein
MAPVVPARSALSLGGAAPPPPGMAGPLAVIFGAPRGETAASTEIAVVFNKPMRALGLGPSAPAPPIALRPVAKGAFHWLGSAALRFDAEAPLAPATAYHVEIPAGTRALDGSTLAEAFTLDFNTPRVTLVGSSPEADATDVASDATVTLTFDQAVTDAEIQRAVTLRAEKAKAALPFRIERQGPAQVELVPARRLPLAERVHVRVDASLRGEEGELPAGRDRELVFSTMGLPAVRGWTCEKHPDDPGACNPDYDEVTLELTGAVPRAALAKAIVIEPPVKWDQSEYLEDSPIGEVRIDGGFQPGVTYRFHLAPSARLVDWTGARLDLGPGQTLRFGHRPARASFGLTGKYWSSRAPHAFDAWLTNTSAMELHLGRRSLDEVLAELAGTAPPPLAGAALSLVAPPLDESTRQAVLVDKLLPGARGAVDLLAGYTPRAGGEPRQAAYRVQITDLGLTARVGHGSAAALVTDLVDGRPAAGAEVALYRVRPGAPAQRLGVGTAGPAGEASLTFPEALAKEDGLVLAARRGGDWTYREIATPRPVAAVGMVYSERGIYRPGETVQLSGVIRVPGPRGLITPQGGSAHVKVHNHGQVPLFEIDTAVSPFGTFAVEVPVPRDAPLGFYAAEATVADGRVWGSFALAEYRPTEIAVEASTERATYARGETLRCGAHGRYLHGGAMAGARATVVVTRSPDSYQVPGLTGFTIQDAERASLWGEIARARLTLDPRGALSFPVALALPGQSGPESVRCAVEAMDLNRQALSASASALVHPGELYVALETPRNNPVEPGDAEAAAVLAVTPAGERRRARVRVDVLQREGEDAAPRDTPVKSCDLTTGAAPVACPFTVPADTADGARILVRAALVDAGGNVVRASYVRYVSVPPKPPAAPPPPSPPVPVSRSLRVATDRQYTVGQTGHVTIESPYDQPATALVTVEREGVLWQTVAPVPGPTARVEFPITEAMIPDADVSVMLVSGTRASRAGDSFGVDSSTKRLAVTVETAGGAAHRPGEEIEVSVKVVDAAGRPARAEVTLWGADEGSLSLIGYRLPDPHRALQDERRVLVTETESRDELVQVGHFGRRHRARPPQVRMGATQRSEPRGDFRQTAFFAAHLVTDEAGRLHRRFTLPDGLTTYRVMAVAVAADDRSGGGKTEVVTSLPLMARASLPRVVRAGDRFEASVVVSGAQAEGDAQVSAEVSGVTLISPARQKVHLEKDTPAEVRFAVRAEHAGAAQLTFRATLGKLQDSMTLARPVVTPIVPETTGIDGEVRGAAAEALGDLSALRPDFGGLEVSLSTTPLAGLADGVEQLVEYPYGCTEQTVSRLVPLLALRDLAEGLGTTFPKDTRRVVDESVARLVSHQRRDGGFGLWRESSRSELWLTAWAVWALDEAGRRGVKVPGYVAARARVYLREALDGASGGKPEPLAVAAFVADLAAAADTPDRALTTRLFAARDTLPPFSRALLLHAMALAHEDPARVADLRRELESLVRLDGAAARVATAEHFHALLDSDTRTTAMLLRALVALDPAHPLVARLARGLLESRHGGRFRTTQEAAWALLALDDLRRARPPAPEGTLARVFLGSALLHESRLTGAASVGFGVPAAHLLATSGQPLAFTADGPLYYRARLHFARRELPTEPVESGLFLRRTVRPVDGDGPEHPAGTVFAGELLAVQLDLATPSPRHALVIESPLPGGLEPADLDLRQGGSWLRAWEQSGGATRRELRDDRVLYFIDELPAGVTTLRYVVRASTPGTFVLPPARAEEMYAPDTFSRTAAEVLTVVALP